MCNNNYKPTLEHVLGSFKYGCQQMAEIVNNRYFDGCADIYWIGDRYDLCDFSGEWWLSPEEMREMLEADLSQKDFLEWWDYNLYNAHTPINLSSWIMGLRPEYEN